MLHNDASFEFSRAWGNLSMQWGAAQATPHLIASMSLRLVIPGWVALQQSPLALRQPSRSCQNRRSIERGNIVIAPFQSASYKPKTVKDVPVQNVKDVSALDKNRAWWGPRPSALGAAQDGKGLGGVVGRRIIAI
jgi:hypothetical protein